MHVHVNVHVCAFDIHNVMYTTCMCVLRHMGDTHGSVYTLHSPPTFLYRITIVISSCKAPIASISMLVDGTGHPLWQLLPVEEWVWAPHDLLRPHPVLLVMSPLHSGRLFSCHSATSYSTGLSRYAMDMHVHVHYTCMLYYTMYCGTGTCTRMYTRCSGTYVQYVACVQILYTRLC